MNKTNKTNKSIIGGAILCLAILALLSLNPLESMATSSCMQNSDCGQNYWESQTCVGNSVYGKYVEWTCSMPNTTVGTCVAIKTDKQLVSCSLGQVCQDINNRAICTGEASNTNTTTNPTYNYHSYQKCMGNSVYWFDSYNNQQDLYQTCSSGQTCSNNACVTSTTSTNYIYHNFKGCINNISYWYDSLGNQQDAYQNCSITGQICSNGQCVGNPTTTTTTATTTNTQTNNVLHYVTKCYGNDIYWYDSKEVIQDIYKSCADNNQCTKDSCENGQCKNELKCDGSTCAAGSADYTKYCPIAATTTASVSENPLSNFLKGWFVWVVIALILIFLFIIIFRRLSSNA